MGRRPLRDLPIARALRDSVHAVQFYETDTYLIDTLAAYVGQGIASGEAAVVVASPEHRAALEERLATEGLDLALSQERGTYVALDASGLLARISGRDGELDPRLFEEIVGGIVTRARGDGSRRVRVFGEMVAVLWAEGRIDASLVLEQLWNDLVRKVPFALVCAYPVGGETADARPSAPHADVGSLHDQGTTLRN